MTTVDELRAPHRLRRLFAPRGVAVVGASERSGWTRHLLANLRDTGFAGPVVPVHPSGAPVFGTATATSLRALAEPVDLAFVLTGAAAVEGVLDDAAAAGVPHAVVLAAGYREQGDTAAEQALLRRAVDSGVTFLGPNGVGFVNTAAAAVPFGLPFARPLRRGRVGVVSQSGALACTVLDVAAAQAVGISTLVSTGNETLVRTTDVLAHLLDDEETGVVALFLEGIRDAPRFLSLLRRAATIGKPVVVLKVGRSPSVQRTALAHTGAVVGDDAVVDAALRQAGAIRVGSLEELVVTAGLLAGGRPPAGRRMAVITESGGANDLIGDGVHEAGIDIPRFAPATAAALREVVPAFGSPENPVDVTGLGLAQQRPGELLPIDRALEIAVRDPGVDFAVYMGIVLPAQEPDPATVAAQRARMAQLAGIIQTSPKPVVCVGYSATDLGPYARRVLAEHDLHMVRGIHLGVRAVVNAVRWAELRAAVRPRPALPPSPEQATAREGVWSEVDARRWLTAHGVPVVEGGHAATVDEAVALAAKLGTVAVKVNAAGLAHKSDVGGVALGLDTEAEVRAVFDTVRAGAGGAADGVLVTAMRGGGLELVVGVTRDPAFGPVLTVGLGGVWIEVLRDTVQRVLPVDRAEIKRMLGELRGAPLLAGARGTRAADLDRVAEAVEGVASAALALGPRLEALEVNPLWVDGAEVEALDALVVMGER